MTDVSTTLTPGDLASIKVEPIPLQTMDEQEIKIGNYSDCRPKDGEEALYHTDIITTRYLWRESLESNYALSLVPVVGQAYFVFLSRPVKVSLNQQFWLFYDCPKAFYDGYETEEEIEQARFCFGQITKIVSYDNTGALIEFTVSKTLTLPDILETKETRKLPAFLADFFIQSVQDGDYALRAVGKYFQLSVSYAQGDIGQFCIFTEYENALTICLLGEWAFTGDWNFGGKYSLPESICKALIPAK